MRTVFHTIEGDGMFTQIAAIAIPPALIIVQDDEALERMEDLVRTFGQKCLKDLVELHPTMNADEARRQSVEVRTLAEVEQVNANEKLAMEVI